MRSLHVSQGDPFLQQQITLRIHHIGCCRHMMYCRPSTCVMHQRPVSYWSTGLEPLIWGAIGVCVCVHRYLDWSTWPNYEVVEFQPRSDIDTVLDTVDSDYNLFHSPAPPVFAAFWIVLFSPPCYFPPSVEVVVVAPLCHNLSPNPLLSWKSAHLYISHNHHPPYSGACLCALRLVPASTVVSHVRSPSLCRPWTSPMPL